jgi:hypothetical protein
VKTVRRWWASLREWLSRRTTAPTQCVGRVSQAVWLNEPERIRPTQCVGDLSKAEYSKESGILQRGHPPTQCVGDAVVRESSSGHGQRTPWKRPNCVPPRGIFWRGLPTHPGEQALTTLQQAWAAASHSVDTVLFLNADDLARRLRRCLQEQLDLIDWGVNADWIKANFALFCRSLGGKIDDPPHYDTVANRLAKMMERGRRDVWDDGVRQGTITVYWVPDPAAAVVDLAERREAS